MPKERGAVIIIEEETLTLIERVRNGRTYYLFPGGGVEPDETREQAARREAYEELGLHINVGRLIAIVTHEESHQYYFLATVTGGEFGTGSGPEMNSAADSDEGSYRPVRLPLSTIRNYDIRPKALAEAILSNCLEETEVVHIQD